MTKSERALSVAGFLGAVLRTAEAFERQAEIWDNPDQAVTVAEAWRAAAGAWKAVRRDTVSDETVRAFIHALASYCAKSAEAIACGSFSNASEAWGSARDFVQDLGWERGREAADAAGRAAMFSSNAAEFAFRAFLSRKAQESWDIPDTQDSFFIGLLNRAWSDNVTFHARAAFAKSGSSGAAGEFRHLLEHPDSEDESSSV